MTALDYITNLELKSKRDSTTERFKKRSAMLANGRQQMFHGKGGTGNETAQQADCATRTSAVLHSGLAGR